MEVMWKRGSTFTGDAKASYERIESIRTRLGGEVSADDIVQDAAKPRSPLHRHFQWDDAIAANEHRREIARHMLRSFVVVRDELKTDRPQRVYEVVRVAQPETPQRVKHVYRTVEDIMQDPDLRAELLGRALRELITIRNRYRDLQELAVVLRAIDEVVAGMEV